LTFIVKQKLFFSKTYLYIIVFCFVFSLVRELCYTARRFEAHEAKDAGLVRY